MQRLWPTLSPLVPLCLAAAVCLGQVPLRSVVLNSPVDRNTAVSFFWFGDMESHWRDPMNFYVASVGDPKLHTVSIGHGSGSKGVETWITAAEMQALVQKLAQSRFGWLDTRKREQFKPWQERTDGHDTFDITVISSQGTVTGGIRVARMCDELIKFDSVMPTPRIRWQFQTLRWDDGCVIPGYDNEAKPKG